MGRRIDVEGDGNEWSTTQPAKLNSVLIPSIIIIMPICYLKLI